MTDRKPSEFRFNADDQETDEFYHEEMKDLRIEKLSQRMTLLSILLPCLIAVAIYFGYRDLTGRMHQDRDSGNLEIQKLSSQMEALSKKFSEKLITFSTTLSSQEQDFGNSISGKLNTINNNIEVLNQSLKSLNENLNQAKKAIKKLDENKADKQNQEAAIGRLTADWNSLKNEFQSVSEMRQSIKSISSEIKNLASQFLALKAETTESIDNLKKDYDTLQTTIARQLSEKIDKAALGVELLMYKKNQSYHSQEITRLTQRLDAIQSKIENMQKDSKLSSQSGGSSAVILPPPQSTRSENSGSTKIESPSTAHEIKLQEQDLPPE